MRSIKIKRSDGTVETLKKYLTARSTEKIKEDIDKTLDIMKERISITDDRVALTEMYVLLVAIHVEPNTTIPVDD